VTEESTKTDLVDRATALGQPVTGRLIDDWVSLGLLDQPDRRGLGRGKGVRATWPVNQVRLFEQLLAARRSARRVKTLCNIPVWTWLTWGDSYVPLRQAKRATETWVLGSGTTPWGHAKSAACAAAGAFPTTVSAKQRRAVERFLTDAVERGRLDEVRLSQVLHDVPEAADHVRVLKARFAAVGQIRSVRDETYLDARAAYLSLSPPRRLGDEGLQERVTSACLDLVTLIGFEIRERRRPN
jgi:hypothetical protein